METHEVQRKLTTIFSTDVQGYSRLMADDETATIRTLTAYKEVISAHIEKHGGRVIDFKFNGGGWSLPRTLLPKFPVQQGKYREILCFRAYRTGKISSTCP